MGESGRGPSLCVLGPLEIRSAGPAVHIRVGRHRRLLMLLLLKMGHWAGTDELTDALWDGRPPRSAAANVRGLVCDWRTLLASLAVGASIDGQRGGYRLCIERHELDATMFEDLVIGARHAAATDQAAAVERFEAALRLWRGDPFEQLGTIALGERTRLAEVREQATAGLAGALFGLGRHADALPMLHAATVGQPFNEQHWARLMLALAHCGRRADALVAYRQVHRMLGDELGVEPGHDLRSVYEQLLTS